MPDRGAEGSTASLFERLAVGTAPPVAADPVSLVIFGGTGDLARRKLLPALYNLHLDGVLPPRTAIVGAGHPAMSDDQYREFAKDGVKEFSRRPIDEAAWRPFAESLFFVPGSFEDSAAFAALGSRLDIIEHERGLPGNRIYYLAVPPSMFVTITEQLARARFVKPPSMRSAPGAKGAPFARLIVEKPIGRIWRRPQAINDAIAKVFDERDIYRIDHYLGKETVQNILVLRFANSIFEPLFNQKFVDHVQITVAEEEGVGTRARYYEQAGALRDMVQNHLLQLLALIAMEPPYSLDADVVRDEKLEVLQSLRPITKEAVRTQTVRAQYTAGFVLGSPVTGIPGRTGRRPRIADGNPCGAAAVHRQLALGWCALLSPHRQAAAETRERNQRAAERCAADPLQSRPVCTARFECPHRSHPARRGLRPRNKFESSRTARAHLSCEDGFSLQQHVRGELPRSLRTPAPRRHGWRSDAVHAPGCRGGGVALGRADSRRMDRRSSTAAGDVPRGGMGPPRGGPADRIHGTAMAADLADRAWRPSALDRIETDLTAVWEELAREAPVSRAAMSNLVVFCRCPAETTIDLALPPEGLPLEEVARQHPARVIVLRHDPDVAAGAPATLSDARVGVMTFGPHDARYGVEEIVIRSACAEAALPSIVRPLLLGDLPTTIWWAEDFSATRPLASLVTLGRQLLYDSRRWRDVRSAALALAPLAADRLRSGSRGRQLAAADTPSTGARACDRVERSRRSAANHHSNRPSSRGRRARLASCRLARGARSIPPSRSRKIRSATDDILTLSFDDGLELRLGVTSVTVEDPRGPAPFAAAIPQESESEAIAAELRVLTHDASFHAALAALARRFGGA